MLFIILIADQYNRKISAKILYGSLITIIIYQHVCIYGIDEDEIKNVASAAAAAAAAAVCKRASCNKNGILTRIKMVIEYQGYASSRTKRIYGLKLFNGDELLWENLRNLFTRVPWQVNIFQRI